VEIFRSVSKRSLFRLSFVSGFYCILTVLKICYFAHSSVFDFVICDCLPLNGEIDIVICECEDYTKWGVDSGGGYASRGRKGWYTK